MKAHYESKVTRLNQSISDLHNTIMSEESASTLDAEEEDLSVECADCLFKCPVKKSFVCLSADCATKRKSTIGGNSSDGNSVEIHVWDCPHVCGFCAVMQHSDSQHRLETRENWPVSVKSVERAIANVKKCELDVQQLRATAPLEAGPIGYLLEMVCLAR